MKTFIPVIARFHFLFLPIAARTSLLCAAPTLGEGKCYNVIPVAARWSGGKGKKTKKKNRKPLPLQGNKWIKALRDPTLAAPRGAAPVGPTALLGEGLLHAAPSWVLPSPSGQPPPWELPAALCRTGRSRGAPISVGYREQRPKLVDFLHLHAARVSPLIKQMMLCLICLRWLFLWNMHLIKRNTETCLFSRFMRKARTPLKFPVVQQLSNGIPQYKHSIIQL